MTDGDRSLDGAAALPAAAGHPSGRPAPCARYG